MSSIAFLIWWPVLSVRKALSNTLYNNNSSYLSIRIELFSFFISCFKKNNFLNKHKKKVSNEEQEEPFFQTLNHLFEIKFINVKFNFFCFVFSQFSSSYLKTILFTLITIYFFFSNCIAL